MMRLRVDERAVHTVSGESTAWVITPTVHLRVGRPRLQAFAARGYAGADLDREMLQAVRELEQDSQLLVFRGRDDAGEGSWAFSDDLDEGEARELGYHLIVDQLPMYRRLVAAGVFALMHVEFGSREVDAYQHGTRRALEELEAGSIPEIGGAEDDAVVQQVDRWVLHNLTFFFGSPLDDVVQGVLERQLPLLRERIPHLRQLTASLPPSAID